MSDTSIIEKVIVTEFAKLVESVEYSDYEIEIDKVLLDLAKKQGIVNTGKSNVEKFINLVIFGIDEALVDYNTSMENEELTIVVDDTDDETYVFVNLRGVEWVDENGISDSSVVAVSLDIPAINDLCKLAFGNNA